MYKFIRTKEINEAIALVAENINSPNLAEVFNELRIDREILVMPTWEFVIPIRPEYTLSIRGRPRMTSETITQTEDFALADGRVVSYTFHAIITPVDATVSTLQTQLYIITAIMILLSVLIAIITARHISKPIEDINKGAKALASGDYNTHFDGKGFLEIKELSDTLNTAATELSKLENLRRELMANVSHDLRTPLALIYSYAEMMQDFPHEITPQQTQTIMDETKRLSSLVNDILDVSHLETRGIELRKEQYNLTESLISTINRTAELIKNENCAINFDYNEKIHINADEVKITQAFYNLLINAVNYSGENKQITVRQSVLGSHVKIEVTDNGEGITPANLPYIWDRYYKADNKHKRPIVGTGMGLSIVKKIIEMHGGKYGASSEIGKGSTFWFEIPISEPD
jgi:signal transduction histidine kinase